MHKDEVTCRCPKYVSFTIMVAMLSGPVALSLRTRELSAEQKFTREQWCKQLKSPRVRQNFGRFLARVTKNSQSFAAHGGILLTPIGTSDC